MPLDLHLRSLPLTAALLFASAPLMAQDAWCEQDGQIVIEVESVPDAGAWEVKTDVPGYTGDSFYRWSGPDLFQSPGQGVMTYMINITEPGDYDLRIRNYHDDPDATMENDCWTRMDGGTWIKTYSGPNNMWTWATRHEYSHDNKDDAHFVLSEGTHTFQISGRSNDFRIDRIHFFLPSVSNPTDETTPESPQLPCDEPNPDLNPTSVTSTFADGTLGGFELKFGDADVVANLATDVLPGSHVEFGDDARVVLADKTYEDQDTLVRIRRGMPEGSWLGVIVRADGENDDFSASGDQTMVYVQRQPGTGRLNVLVRDETGVLFIGPFFELTEIDPDARDVLLRVSTNGNTVDATLNGLSALGGGYSGIADPSGGGYTSLRTNLNPTFPGEIGVDYVLTRTAGDVPDISWDTNGKMWISMFEPDLFSPGVWEPATFVFQHKQFMLGLSPFVSIVVPLFDYISLDNDHFVLGFVDSGFSFPSGSVNLLSYKGQTEGGLQP